MRLQVTFLLNFLNGALDFFQGAVLFPRALKFPAIHFSLAASGLIALVFGLLFLGGGGLGCHCSPIPHGIVRDGSGFSDHIPLLTLRAYKSIIRRRGLDRQEALNPFK